MSVNQEQLVETIRHNRFGSVSVCSIKSGILLVRGAESSPLRVRARFARCRFCGVTLLQSAHGGCVNTHAGRSFPSLFTLQLQSEDVSRKCFK